MDTATYAHYKLRNGLSVIVASDPELQREAACMAVAVGQMSDPKAWPGLAHFTEHMLFLGSEKFPDEADYKKYLSANGGSSNAATGSDYTYYWFDVRAGKLQGALDRFSGFFTSPLFDESSTRREMEAIDSEHRCGACSNHGWTQFAAI